MARCPSCRQTLLVRAERLGARCPYCRDPLYERPISPRPPALDDSLCAVHPMNAATGTCQRCGNYLCPICRTPWRGQKWCTACVERAVSRQTTAPEEERAHRRQAILSVVFGVGGWAVLAVAVGIIVVGAGLMETNMPAGQVLLVVGVLVMLVSPLLSILGIGQGAAAVRARGDHLILATAGLLLSLLHVGLLIGLFTSNIRHA